MTTCLVTGAAGFVASSIVKHILATTDWTVFGWDKLTYAAENGRRLADIWMSNNPRFSFSRTDICNIEAFPNVQVDYIVHCAAETHVDSSITNPFLFFHTNAFGTFSMLQWARGQKRLRKFLYFSTDEVFGSANEATFLEWSRYRSNNPYAATKAAGEEMALAWQNTYGIPVVVSHCSNVFGPMQHPEKFIPKLVEAIGSGKTIDIHATEQGVIGSRMYVHSSDVARAVVTLLEKGKTGEKYNVGGREINNLSLAQKIAEIMGKELSYQLTYPFRERPGWDISYRINATKLAKLGWTASPNFDELLRQVVLSEMKVTA